MDNVQVIHLDVIKKNLDINVLEKIKRKARIIFTKGPASATNDFSMNEHELKNFVDD